MARVAKGAGGMWTERMERGNTCHTILGTQASMNSRRGAMEGKEVERGRQKKEECLVVVVN